MKNIATMFIVLLSFSVLGQVSNFEDFNYGEDGGLIDNISSLLWTGTGEVPTYTYPGLTKNGYSIENIGGQLNISSSNNGNVYRIINEITSSETLYISFLLNLSSTSLIPDCFFSIGSPNGTLNTAKIYAKMKSGGGQADGWNIGLQKDTENPDFANARLQFGRIYIVVLKYVYNIEGNDQLGLWVYYEPLNPLEGQTPAATIQFFGSNIADVITVPSSIIINQGTGRPTGAIDAIRISNNWNDIPLPVELTFFTSIIQKDKVQLNWTTSTETNNFGFDVERSTNNVDWSKLAFLNGKGNSNSVTNYSYIDNNLNNLKYYYRLKQIDNNGMFKYSEVINVDLSNEFNFSLFQNYPNPFNPNTLIKYTLPENSLVKLTVYNSLGEIVKVLENQEQIAGTYQITFNALGLTSGIYFYKLEAGNFTQMKKMILMK